ncbi:expressed unknown protein [Seminavis robusta]|uniref:RING-type domain-containing protein n=1 Tax=Seminavis robusta TaxID=568900 RepID=A0A9N8E869_9STRA|nr:expressed unknown protein [Seminavis robusta]|eukprot:Sro790_g202760.1 n/a (223) ;mRNA; r:7795-8559
MALSEKHKLIIGMIGACMGFVIIVFFLSCQQEWCCGVFKKRDVLHRKGDDDDDYTKDSKTKVPTKVFLKSDATKEPMATMEEGDGEEESDIQLMMDSEQMGGANNKHNLITESMTSVEQRITNKIYIPRCVLCSKDYEEGENVTHSNNPNCHHEYHENCLYKHWKKVKAHDGKCPVCKTDEQYVVEKLAPSTHFSTTSLRQSKQQLAPSSTRTTSVGPFDAV